MITLLFFPKKSVSVYQSILQRRHVFGYQSIIQNPA